MFQETSVGDGHSQYRGDSEDHDVRYRASQVQNRLIDKVTKLQCRRHKLEAVIAAWTI